VCAVALPPDWPQYVLMIPIELAERNKATNPTIRIIQLTQRTAMNSRSSNDDIERLRTLPKAEVHLHLEGCFEPSVIEKWSKSEGVALPRPRENSLKFSGLADFLGFLDLACGLASTSERLVELSYGLSRRLAESGAG
jgi:hypothetical protein